MREATRMPEPEVLRVPERPGHRVPRVTSGDALFVPALIVLLGLYLRLRSPFFFTSRNIEQLLLQGSVLGIAAVGVTFVVICGELDLSIGSNVALSGVVAAVGMTSWTHNWVAGALLGVGCGLAIGLVNGILTAYVRVPAFIATLGTGVIAGGFALYLTKGLTIAGLPKSFAALATTKIVGLQSLVWFMFGSLVLGGILLHLTNYGIRTFSVGDNREAAFLAGLPVAALRLTNFVIAGLSGGLGGTLLTARVQAGQPGIGTSLTLYATAAVILGGTSILGGQGSMVRTAFGVLLIAVVQNGLDILGVDYALQQVAVGAVFVLAACSEAVRRRR